MRRVSLIVRLLGLQDVDRGLAVGKYSPVQNAQKWDQIRALVSLSLDLPFQYLLENLQKRTRQQH